MMRSPSLSRIGQPQGSLPGSSGQASIGSGTPSLSLSLMGQPSSVLAGSVGHLSSLSSLPSPSVSAGGGGGGGGGSFFGPIVNVRPSRTSGECVPSLDVACLCETVS